MKASKVSELLPIPDGVRQPHAYQVFGLEAGKVDDEGIDVAIQATIERLKRHKESADPEVWKTAARLVRQAESILRDSEKRNELDAQFGIVKIPAEPNVPVESAPFDPLAGVLPSADPLADAPPQTSQEVPPAPVAPVASVVTAPAAPFTPSRPEIVAVKSTTPRRRRRSSSSWFLGLMTLGLFAIIGILAYFVFYGPGELAITRTDGSLTISTGKADGRDKTAVPEPVMTDDGQAKTNFEPAVPEPSRDAAADPSAAEKSLLRDGEPAEGLPPELQELLDNKPMPPAVKSPMPADGENDPNKMLPVKPAAETDETEMTEEMVAAVDTKIEQLRSLIRAAKWKEMTPAAAALKEQLMTGDQRIEVESLYQIADLASYYFGAIERGILGRQAAETITIAGALTVAIVEVGPDLLIIRYAGRNKSFKFSELPLNLAHRMAEFALAQDKATNVAAKACYQAISSLSNDDDRQEAIQWLREIQEDVAGVRPKQIADTIEALY